MGQVIIVSDDRRFAKFVKSGISNVAQKEVIVSPSAVDAIKQLNEIEHIDLIVSMYSIRKEPSFNILNRYLVKQNRIINLLVLESTEVKLPSYAHQILDYKDPNKVINACIREIGLNVFQDKKNDNLEFTQINVNFLNHIKIAPCDIFVRILKEKSENQYLKRVHKGDSIDSELVEKYCSQNIQYLFVKSIHHQMLIKCIYAQFSKVLSRNTISLERRIKATEDSYSFCLDQIQEQGLNLATIALTNSIIDSFKKSMIQVSDKRNLINLIKCLIDDTQSFRYKHTHLISIFSAAIIRNSEWGNREQIEKLIHVSFFHDITLEKDSYAKIETMEDLESSNFVDSEKKIILNHAHDSSKLAAEFPDLSPGASLIIKQHHGKENGIGFSDTLNVNMISKLALVFNVAENFTCRFLNQLDKGDRVDIRQLIEEVRENYPTQTMQVIIDSLSRAFK
jgi:HD-GYP domain-containing protein (c-di-GMP phosphodiesterase class II)